MAPLFGAWPSNRRRLYNRIHRRLSKTGGCRNIRYEPNALRAREVVADVDPTMFLGREYATEVAHLRVEFALGYSPVWYRINWWEPAERRGFGWHQDQTEPTYGPVHFQVEREDGTTTRQRSEFVVDEHPYHTFERRLSQIETKLTCLGWW